MPAPGSSGRSRFQRDSPDTPCHVSGMRTLSDRLREQAQADADDRDLTSRTDRRRAQNTRETALKDLAVALVGLKPKQLERFELSEQLLSAIASAQAMKSPNARNRQVSVVRQHLRDLGPGVELIEARLAALKGGSAAPGAMPAAVAASEPPSNSALAAWLERLVSEGDPALEELLGAHPEADRQSIRQAARAAAKVRQTGGLASAVKRADERLRKELEPLVLVAPQPSAS
jgi:ribosome-associated protein